MNASNKLRRMNSHARLELLEGRRLLSGWTTVDTDASSYDIEGMAADNAGNVYAVGADNSNNANLRQESGGVWSTAITVADGGQTSFYHLATDAAGDVFIAGSVGSAATIWERPVGQSNLVVIDSISNGAIGGIATDAAGDLFASASQSVITTAKGKTTTTHYGIVRKYTALSGGGFVAGTSTLGASINLAGITVIGSGAGAGVYVVGDSSSNWQAFKSGNGGASWSLVDQFRYDAGSASNAYVVAGDATGNVFVAGEGNSAVITGYSRSGKPVYGSRGHWVVRHSLNGNSGSWSTVDDYLPTGDTEAYPLAMGTDLAGSVYVAGSAAPASGAAHAIVRTNAGGTWSTSDDFTGRGSPWTYYSGVAVDSSGTVYCGGSYGDAAPPTFVRSMAGPASASVAQPTSLFSASTIASASRPGSARLVDELFAA